VNYFITQDAIHLRSRNQGQGDQIMPAQTRGWTKSSLVAVLTRSCLMLWRLEERLRRFRANCGSAMISTTLGHLLLLPALILVFALEPWQRAQIQRGNAGFFNHRQLDSALEQDRCPDANIPVVTPLLIIVDGEACRRLIELQIIPSEQ